MKKLLFAPVLLALTATFSIAQTPHSDKEVKEDIQRHRAMATAHEAAAKCLESGKKNELCQKELQAAYKGLAIGKYCGMKRAHKSSAGQPASGGRLKSQ